MANPTSTASPPRTRPRPDGTEPAPLAEARGPRRTDLIVLAALAVAAWALVVGAARAWGMYLEASGTRLVLFTPPVLGGYRPSPPAGLVAAVLVGLALAVALPWAAERLPWRGVVGAATAGAAAWWISLALVDGTAGLTKGLDWDIDYADAVIRVSESPGRFLADYVSTLPDQPIALRGHPPGFALLFGAMDRIGLHGEAWAAAVVVVVSLSAVPALLLTLRVVAGGPNARRSAPFVALTPAAIWVVTSTDGITMATAAWGLALLAMAGERSRSVRADLLAAGAGLALAFAVLQSYGMALLAIPVVALAAHQRRWRPLVVVAATGAGVVVALTAWGFWLLGGLAATLDAYHTLDLERPYQYFLVGNLGAWALALGPATAAGLALLRDRGTWVIVGSGAAAAMVASLSGLSEGEVERIWLPFTLLVIPAASCLWRSRAQVTGWLAGQVAAAAVLTALVETNW